MGMVSFLGSMACFCYLDYRTYLVANMALAVTVHTTGIDWASVLTTIGSIIVIVTALFAVFTNYIGNRITHAIDRLRIEVIAGLDTRVTRLEAIELGVENDNPNDSRARRNRRQ